MQQHGSLPLHRNLAWAEPLALLSSLPCDAESCWVLLYSGMRTGFTGRYSFLALREHRSVRGEDFSCLEKVAAENAHPVLDGWFGYLGYGLKNSVEKSVVVDIASPVFTMPSLWMVQYRLVLVFDHDKTELCCYARTEEDLACIPSTMSDAVYNAPVVQHVASNMTTREYYQKFEVIKAAIAAGDLYQANLTRKFSGTLAPGFSPVGLFQQLCAISPAPYSAMLKLRDTYILSSSPEQFLHLDNNGEVSTRPIKGSARRHADTVQDSLVKEVLLHSEKNRAENLMIVDLMRNDLSRSCEAGSVKVESLFDVTSYATIHHLSSSIKGKKKVQCSPAALIKACFPPGSMTGAPKIKAIELASRLEIQARGIYSGCIGWLGGDGTADLSVVIRTLLLKNNRFEFQVGGAIVADSTVEEERQETLSKACAIAKVLGISMETLDNI